MKFNTMMITLAAATNAFLSVASAQTQPQCMSVTLQTQAVALSAPRSGSIVNFTGSGGQLDPVPLLESTFTIPQGTSKTTCVFVTFSAQTDFSDNYGVYQTSIDDVPMIGHGTLTAEYPNITTPVVFDAVNQGTYLTVAPYQYPNYSNSRFVSYTFFAVVTPGTHVMRVRVAACCSQSPVGFGGVFVRNATAVMRW